MLGVVFCGNKQKSLRLAIIYFYILLLVYDSLTNSKGLEKGVVTELVASIRN